MKTLILIATLSTCAVQAAETSTYGQRIVAAVICGESMSEGERGMTAVAEVIRNRAKSSGKSPLEVVLEHGQFSCLKRTTLEKLYKKFYRKKDYQVALRIAKTCYNFPSKLPNTTKGAMYFDRKRDHPYWLSAVRLTATIGNHNFYVLR